SCPSLRLSTEEKKRLRDPWRNTLIVKLLGKSIGIRLHNVKKPWRTSGDFELPELGHGYFLGKFDNYHDCTEVLKGGPSTKTKYVCMCVEVDLSKTLVGKMEIGLLTQLIDYEGIHLICFKCGIVGHKSGSCTISGLMTSKNQANDLQLMTLEIQQLKVAMKKPPPYMVHGWSLQGETGGW
ncbi:DUF4283 domain-containing protein/zf-CCHC_4 domain-containing protein, partial [Cephalotus follicularis]